ADAALDVDAKAGARSVSDGGRYRSLTLRALKPALQQDEGAVAADAAAGLLPFQHQGVDAQFPAAVGFLQVDRLEEHLPASVTDQLDERSPIRMVAARQEDTAKAGVLLQPVREVPAALRPDLDAEGGGGEACERSQGGAGGLLRGVLQVEEAPSPGPGGGDHGDGIGPSGRTKD